MKRRFVKLVAVIARGKSICASLCLMLSLITVSAQIKLSFNPELETKYEYQMEGIQNLKQNVMGQEMSMKTVMKGTYLMEIKDKTPQEIHTQMTYQGFTIVVSSSVLNVTYDSKVPNKNPSEMDKMFEKMFSTLIGKPFTVVFALDGSVKSVSGMGDIIKNMLESISDDEQLATQMGAQMSQMFSDETMKNMFGQSFNAYPDNTVKVGDSWDMENTIPMNNMNLSIKTKNTLKKINKNKATIEVTGNMDMEMEESKFTGIQTGTTIIDTTTGLPVTNDVSLNMKGTVKTQGMEIQMEIISKAKTEIKKIN